MSDNITFFDSGKARIAAQLDNVAPLVSRIVIFCRNRQISDENITAIELAASEAINNAVEHGSGEDPQKSVDVAWWIEGTLWHLEVTDSGQFMPSAEQEQLPEDLLSDRGRGSFLMAQLSDSVEHDLIQGHHHLKLTRDLKAAPSPVESPEEMDETIASMAEEISTSYENLSALFRLAEKLAIAPSFKEFINSSLDELTDLTRSTGARVSGWDTEAAQLETQGAYGSLSSLAESLQLADAATIEIQTATESIFIYV